MNRIISFIAFFIVAILFFAVIPMIFVAGTSMWRQAYCMMQGKTEMWCFNEANGGDHFGEREYTDPSNIPRSGDLITK